MFRGTRAQVACGFAYTAAVGGGGALYTWGAGENGRLGTGTTADQPLPTAVRADMFVGGSGAAGEISVRQARLYFLRRNFESAEFRGV